MMINALVTLRIEFFWQSVASGVVIILSVAFYTWLQKKDRDGSRGIFASLSTPDNVKTFRLAIMLAVTLIGFSILGFLFASDVTGSG